MSPQISEPRPCVICGRPYRQDKLKNCPSCAASKTFPGVERKRPTPDSSRISSQSFIEQDIPPAQVSQPEDVIALLKRVEFASNRTTHAVRAFVLFLFIQLSATTAAIFFYYLADIVGNSNENCPDEIRAYGLCSPNAFFLLIAIVIWISGIVGSSIVGWNEVDKSKIY